MTKVLNLEDFIHYFTPFFTGENYFSKETIASKRKIDSVILKENVQVSDRLYHKGSMFVSGKVQVFARLEAKEGFVISVNGFDFTIKPSHLGKIVYFQNICISGECEKVSVRFKNKAESFYLKINVYRDGTAKMKVFITSPKGQKKVFNFEKSI